MTLTLTDLFCGAGGSSTGATFVPGVQVRMAANHWQLAVDTHNSNHPEADHSCADLSQVDPRYFPRTDLLWASPECTNHSVAKGKARASNTLDMFEPLPDEAAERSRATMWDVVRFTEHHRYQAVLVENVVDAWHWPPFTAWLMAMDSLGYEHQLVFMNSMHAQAQGLPAPQSRDRMYVVFHRKGNTRPDLAMMQRPLAWCPTCDVQVRSVQSFKKPDVRWGRYRAQYVYRCPNVACRNSIVEPDWLPASSIIDWSIPGQRIGDRARPLAPKTLARVRAGIDRYWGPVAVPVEGREGKSAQSLDGPLRTLTTRLETAVATPPFFAELRGGGSVARLASDPLATVTASGNHHALVVPYYSNSIPRPDSEALPTVTTVDRHALLMTNTHGNRARPVTEPTATQTTATTQALLQPAAERQSVSVEDVRFRMLEPREVIAAMAFPTSYVVLGNRREQVRMAGNAVTPPAARDLVAAVAASLS